MKNQINQMDKIPNYTIFSPGIHLPSSMYLYPLCVHLYNPFHTGYCKILCKYVNMAMSLYDLFDTEDCIMFPLEYIHIHSKSYGKRKFSLYKIMLSRPVLQIN